MDIYIVKSGDTLWSIANEFGVSVERLAYDNDIQNDVLVVGQALIVLYPEIDYIVENGDTLTSIADKFGISTKKLVRNNSFLLNENFLLPGRELIIRYKNQQEKGFDVFGYAYHYIREELLEESCLYIDEILPFSYGYNEDGSLIPLNDERILETANRFEIGKRMVLTPLDKMERFNNQLVVQLVTEEELRNTLIDHVIATMQEKGYEALDIDFEFIPGEYRGEYVAFLSYVVERLHAYGYSVSVAVPPKISDNQRGLLYEGIDYAAIGTIADRVFLMTYEWGYKYGPPMSIAPIPSVRRVLDYAITVIPREKIDMGIPNYAYDWPLPYVRNETVAQTIGNQEAIELAALYQAQIEYDAEAKAPYFYYQKEGLEHIVWFEDVRSIAEKYRLIEEYGFQGGGYWNLMRAFRQNWMYLNQIH